MSWFTRSIANTLNLDVDEQHRVNKISDEDISTDQKHEQQIEEDNSPLSPGRGVKEDLSEITKTLTRQFWGVASFLAPPPPPERSSEQPEPSDPELAATEAIYGIRRDFAEIGGRFRSGISKLSNNIDVSEITKLASNFLQLESDDEDDDSTKGGGGAVGLTDEVVAFARDIAMHPETWLEFPLPEDEDDDEDFELSDAQQVHALAVEHLAPRLAALRIELCPGYMSESSFWKIYFVLLHPRLERCAAEHLSTPEIAKARASLAHGFRNRSDTLSKQEGPRPNSSSSSDNIPNSTRERHPSVPLTADQMATPDTETEKHPIPSDEIPIVDKSVIQEEPHNDVQKFHSVATSPYEANDEDDADDWLKDESSSGRTMIPIENDDDDVSFSDLEEEEEDGNVPINYKKAAHGSDSSTKDSRDWVRLARSSDGSGNGSGLVSVPNSETKEPNDWLDLDDVDMA